MKALRFILSTAVVAAILSTSAATTSESATEPTKPAVTSLRKGEQIPVDDLPLILDFSATWCGPCRMFAPIFNDAASRYAGKARFMKVDVDECRDLAVGLGIRSVPQVAAVLPDSTILFASPGMMPADAFDEFINQMIGR